MNSSTFILNYFLRALVKPTVSFQAKIATGDLLLMKLAKVEIFPNALDKTYHFFGPNK